MGLVDGDELGVLLPEGSKSPPSSSSTCFCRICHEEEEYRSSSMESPCACSGSLKFAHRGCIQEWIDKKGSTICEICLQKFEPGYTTPPPPPPKPHLIDVVLTIRGSLEVARLIDEPQSPAMVMIADSLSERRHASKSHQTFFQLLSLLLSITYLTRHLLSIPSVNNDQFGSTLVIEFLLRWVGIMLPICLILQLVITVRNSRRTQQFHERRGFSVHSDTEADLEQQQE